MCVVSCFSLGLVKALDLIWLDPPFTPPFVFPWSTEIAEYMMKFKPNQTRTYDGEGFKRRAACLCFKNEKEDEVWMGLIEITSLRDSYDFSYHFRTYAAG